MGTKAQAQFSQLPLVGRSREIEMIHTVLDEAAAGRGRTLVLSGEGGVGKSRLLQTAEFEAARRGWSAAVGRAYPVESGIPYAPFTDAFAPLLGAMPAESLAVLTRGAEGDLTYLFPMIRPPEAISARPLDDPRDFKTRVLWSFNQFLSRFSARQPLLILLDDLQWADPSSLELLHFLGRQISGMSIALVCAYNDTMRERLSQLEAITISLASLDSTRLVPLSPLAEPDIRALVERSFGIDASAGREFASLLHRRTRGNPFFLQETLKSLVGSGQLHREGGRWLGWEVENVELPVSVREAVLRRLGTLSTGARSLADLMAIVGTSTRHDTLGLLSELRDRELIDRIDELRQKGVIAERLDGSGTVTYDFIHPMVRETVYGSLGLARARKLHGEVALALETLFAPDPDPHADVLAYHFSRTPSDTLTSKAVHYLTLAGGSALLKYANREAANYLSAALERTLAATDCPAPMKLLEDLARARQRLGEFQAAIDLWERVREAALVAGDVTDVARVERRLGMVFHLGGHDLKALELYSSGLRRLAGAGDHAGLVQLKLAQADCLLDMGRAAEARTAILDALEMARRLESPRLLARAHLASLLLHMWTGPPEVARAEAEEALALAAEMGDTAMSCTAHWGLTILSGLTGNPPAVAHHASEAARLADELRSPLHRLRVDELRVEYMGMTGDWQGGLALGERSIASARALNQRAALARLLAWTAIIHVGRGDMDRAAGYVAEATELTGSNRGVGLLDIHSVMTVHCAWAAYHLGKGEFGETVRICEAGIAIADRTGYLAWPVHRLLPLLGESYLWVGNIEGAARVAERLRKDSRQLGHRMGRAWADACEAILDWLRGDSARAIESLRAAAGRLEAIDMRPDAARVRRHLAARLRDQGDREGALIELRRAHEVFVRLGAERELAKTRDQIRELGARPPLRGAGAAASELSSRELEIARLVAERQSNKAIGKILGISSRTVGTHLSNIFQKVGVESRAELVEFIRRAALPFS